MKSGVVYRYAMAKESRYVVLPVVISHIPARVLVQTVSYREQKAKEKERK